MRTALFTLGQSYLLERLIERTGQRVFVIREEPTTEDDDAYQVQFSDGHQDLAFDEELSDWRDEQ